MTWQSPDGEGLDEGLPGLLRLQHRLAGVVPGLEVLDVLDPETLVEDELGVEAVIAVALRGERLAMHGQELLAHTARSRHAQILKPSGQA